jgi:hypothetical protein
MGFTVPQISFYPDPSDWFQYGATSKTAKNNPHAAQV